MDAESSAARLVDAIDSDRQWQLKDDEYQYDPQQTPPISEKVLLVETPEHNIKAVTDELPLDPQEEAALVLGTIKVDELPLIAYPMRYYVLLVTCMLITSNTMVWIALAPVSKFADGFFSLDGASNYLSLVYMVSTIIFGVFAMWASGRFGLRASILTAACFNGIGASIRLGSCFLPPAVVNATHPEQSESSYRFPVALVGQATAACAYPFIMFLPTKVAGSWFPERQLTLATMVATLSNPMGVLLPNLIVPKLVLAPDDVVLATALVFVPCIVAMLLALLGIRSDGPPTPPTHAAGLKQMDFCSGVKKCLKSRAFIILCFALGGGIGMFNCFYTVFQQLICPYGYSTVFSGICPTLMIVCGLVGGTVSAIVADKTMKYEEMFKGTFSLTTICGILMLQLCMHADFHVWILLGAALFGFFGLSAYGLGLSLGAECTFPVAETTSTGIIVLVGQVQSTIFVLIMNFFATPLPEHLMDIQTCTIADVIQPDMTEEQIAAKWPVSLITPSLILSAIATVMAVVNTCTFKPKYRRQNTNRETETARQEKLKAAHIELQNGEEMIDIDPRLLKPAIES